MIGKHLRVDREQADRWTDAEVIECWRHVLRNRKDTLRVMALTMSFMKQCRHQSVDSDRVWHNISDMARMTVKLTYSLDIETSRTLIQMATQWKVSKSEALRRAIRLASETASSDELPALGALDSLQQSLRLSDTARTSPMRPHGSRPSGCHPGAPNLT